jgi:hypothetical protein
VTERVPASLHLVDAGRNLAQLPLRTDVAEVDGEDLEQVLDLVVDGADLAVEQPRNVLLEQVRIRDEHAADLEVDDKGCDQRPRELRIGLDHGEVGADRPEMGGVDLNVPFVGEAGKLGGRKIPVEHLADHQLRPGRIAGVEHLLTDLRDQVERRRR